MSEEGPENPRTPKYRDPKLVAPKRNTTIREFNVGAVVGAIAVAVPGVAVFLGTMPFHGRSVVYNGDRAIAIGVFFGIAVIGAAIVRPLKMRRQYFFLGMVCGAAMLALIEGLCFGVS